MKMFSRNGYFFFFVLRFVWTLVPQSGYIFPDEFFQSPEVMAKDVLSFNTTTTWEWDRSFPTRSPVSAFLSSGIPYMMLKLLEHFSLIKTTSYLLLVFPRIFMTLISVFSFDMSVYILCNRFDLDPFLHLFVLATSHVTQVFATRSLSNVLETGIFGILLVLLVPRNYKVNAKTDKCEYYNISKLQCFLAGCLTSFGFFIRQSFLGFAITPYIGWLVWQLRSQRDLAKIIEVIINIAFMGLGFILATIVIIFVDSWYFGCLQNGQVVLTCWNSILYNSQQAHVHGHHPCLTHFLVNIPLLFGPIALCYYSKLVSFCIWRDPLPHNGATLSSALDYTYYWYLVLWLSSIVPVLLLSFIPHQEPRFIMPVMIPLVLLFSHTIAESPLFVSWCIWNAIGALFFGILHQGGVVPSLIHLETVIKDSPQRVDAPFCHHVIYFHTYMPPSHLLLLPKKNSLNGHQLYLHDLGGSSHDTFHKTMSKLKEQYCPENQSMLYVLCPGTVKLNVETENISHFFPHLSMEDPPNLNYYVTQLMFGKSTANEPDKQTPDGYVHKIKAYFQNLANQMQELKAELSLTLYILKM